jgi:hypothetical protein
MKNVTKFLFLVLLISFGVCQCHDGKGCCGGGESIKNVSPPVEIAQPASNAQAAKKENKLEEVKSKQVKSEKKKPETVEIAQPEPTAPGTPASKEEVKPEEVKSKKKKPETVEIVQPESAAPGTPAAKEDENKSEETKTEAGVTSKNIKTSRTPAPSKKPKEPTEEEKEEIKKEMEEFQKMMQNLFKDIKKPSEEEKPKE